MNADQYRRTIQAMDKTQRMLAKLEAAYERRPAHLRTDDDRKLISFYRGHVAKLAAMLAEPEWFPGTEGTHFAGRPVTLGVIEDSPLVSAARDISKFEG